MNQKILSHYAKVAIKKGIKKKGNGEEAEKALEEKKGVNESDKGIF